jgi:AcrR family transcriptional regulator
VPSSKKGASSPGNRRRRRRAAAATSVEVAPRAARLERRRSQSREEILDAARRVLVKDGIAATTLDAVAREVGVTKTALYYYFDSKDALLFELFFRIFEAQARSLHDAVEKTESGGDALRAIIVGTLQAFASRLDDFRLVFMHNQVAGAGGVHIDERHLARVRPLNDLCYGGAARRLADERRRRPSRARVEPRLMAFLANVAAVGVLTMKGMVEGVGDPLIYSDEQLAEGLARIFEAAAAP